MSRFCHDLGLSDRGLAKLCSRESIPVPPRGYWAKLQFGKPVTKPPLGPLPDGHREWIPIAPTDSALGAEGREWLEQEMARRGWSDTPVKTELKEPQHDHDMHVRAWQVIKRLGNVRVRSSELSPANRHWEIERSLVAAKDEMWRYPFPPNPFRGAAPKRRLAFLNAVLIGIERLGASGAITDSRAQFIEIRLDGARISCRLQPTAVKVASGERTERLDFHLYQNNDVRRDRQVWKERSGRRIEGQLREIVVGIALAKELENRERDWREYGEGLQRREEKRRQQERKRLERRRLARDELVQQARTMQDARALREMVAAVQRTSRTDVKVARWLRWALDQAEEIDPVAVATCRLMFPLEVFALPAARLTRAGMAMRPANLKPVTTDQLAADYATGLSIARVAAKHGLSEATVRERFKKANIPTRSHTP